MAGFRIFKRVQDMLDFKALDDDVTLRKEGGVLVGSTGGGGGGAPTDVDYLVGTASGDLSAEIVVGTSPAGELGGTWASPTVDTTHSGSSHATVQAAAEATAAAALLAHTSDATDAHAGTAITNTPAGNVAATTVQAAINELDTEKAVAVHAHAGEDITSGTVADARIASTIARDSEVTSSISALSSVYQPLDSDLTAIAALADPNADRILFWDDSAGAYKLLAPGTGLTITGTTIDAAGGGSVATDAIFDVKGDLAVGTGADTAAKLTAGANGKIIIADSSQTTGFKYDYPPGYQFDYVERTTNLSVSATTPAGADTFITGNAVSYDGSTRILVEVFVVLSDARQFVELMIWDGSTDLGCIASYSNANSANAGSGMHGMRFLTPSNASHTYTIKAWRGGTIGTIYAGSGGTAGENLPAFLRITKA